jgi:hypothetical protein
MNKYNIIKEEESEIKINEKIFKEKVRMIQFFSIFKFIKKLNSNYSNIIEVNETAFYLNNLTKKETDFLFLYSNLFHYIFSKKNLLFYLLNNENNKYNFLKIEMIKDLNNNDFNRLIYQNNPIIFENRYKHYYLYPFFETIILNYIFLKSFKYMIKLI